MDNLIYCGCGAGVYRSWGFRCNSPKHGSGWVEYEDSIIKHSLKGLKPFEEVSILLLGETGVGKSTWINAFNNYLTHESLNDAVRSPLLTWAIPCSFQTQMAVNGRFEQREIKVGSSKTEMDGSTGQSATQRTSVYTVNIGNLCVRLIDTPGIGDTRGVDQDNENMMDNLNVLRGYDKLHGIVISRSQMPRG